MRFITEFKVPTGMSKEGNPTYIQTWRSNMQLKLGTMIAESFDWQNPTNHNPAHHRLEIEAFPMDKWVEFKNRLFAHIDFCNEEDRPVDEIRVLNLIKELESFGKPSEVEKEMMNLKEPEYRGPSSHCKACEDEKAGIKHIQAQNHTCKK